MDGEFVMECTSMAGHMEGSAIWHVLMTYMLCVLDKSDL